VIQPKKKGSRLYNPRFIAKMIAEFEHSGLKQHRFARQYGLNPSTLYNWLLRAGKLNSTSEKPALPALLPVSIKASTSTDERGALVLELPSGARLTLPPTIDLQSLAALLREL
jgi:transposase-like protein